MLYAALHDAKVDVRATAAWALDEIGKFSDLIVDCLTQGLTSRNRQVVANSALHLGRLGEHASRSLPALYRFLRSESREHEHGQVTRPRLAVAQAIRRIEAIEQ